MLSRPISSTSMRLSARRAMSFVILPSPTTSAKSRTRFKYLFAILGVPRERLASSLAPSSSQYMPRSVELRIMISASWSSVYGSSLCITPNLSRKGEDICPERVVAPTSVNLFNSILMLLAAGPLPMIISSAKSSSAE